MTEQKITLTLPPILLKKITEIVKDSDTGYESTEEFFKEAVRILLRDVEEYRYFIKK